jgi:hypothetical protein
MIQLTEEQLNKILERLNDVLGLFGYGAEYNKIVAILKELPLENIDLSQYYYIYRELRSLKRKMTISGSKYFYTSY